MTWRCLPGFLKYTGLLETAKAARKVSLELVGGVTVGSHLWQRLIDLCRIQTTRAQPLQPLLFLDVSPGTLHTTLCAGTDPLLQQLQLTLECFVVWLVCSLAQTCSSPLAVILSKNTAKKGKDLQETHLDLWKEMSEAAFWVDLKRRSQVQYELHDDGLVGHLFHQGMFLEVNNKRTRPASTCGCCCSCLPPSVTVERQSRAGLPSRMIVVKCITLEVFTTVPRLERVACFGTQDWVHSRPRLGFLFFFFAVFYFESYPGDCR